MKNTPLSSRSESSIESELQHPWLFRAGWLLFFAGTPFMGWNSLGLLLLLIHVFWDRGALGRLRAEGERSGMLFYRPVVIALVGLALAGSISSALAVAPGRGFASLLGIVLSMSFGLIYSAILEARERGWYVRYLWPLILTTAAHAGWALWTTAFGGELRARTFAPPTAIGTLMLFGLGLGAIWFLSQRDWRKWLLVPYSGWIAAALVATLSRGSWLALGVLLVMASWPAWRQKRLRPYAIAAVVLALAATVVTLEAVPAVAQRASRFFAASERLGIYGAAINMFLDHPFFGVGPSNFGEHWAAYAPPSIGQHFGFPHNGILQVLTETGLLGGVFFGLALVYVLVLIWRMRRTNDLALWVLASGVVAMLVRDQVDTAIFNINLSFVFWWMAGTLVGAGSERGHLQAGPPNERGTLPDQRSGTAGRG